MPTYRYQAANQQGKLVRGSLLAATRDGALARLRELGYLPVNLSEADSGSGTLTGRWLVSNGGSSRAVGVGRGRGVSATDVVTFTRELADLLQAGLELDRALGVLSEVDGGRADGGSSWPSAAPDRHALQELIVEVRAEVQSGRSFGEALSRYPRLFPASFTGLVRSGEAAGDLDIVLARLAQLLESEQAIKGFIRRSLVYPGIVAVTSLLAIVVMMTFVIPRFSRIFVYLGRKLPWPTQLLVSLSGFITAYGWVAAVAALGITLLLRAYLASESGRQACLRFAWSGPVVGRFYRKFTLARLARTLGALLGNGVTLSGALAIVAGAETNRLVRDKLASVSRQVAAGAPVSRLLGSTGLFPPRAVQVLRVGEETGNLDAMFLRVAETYEAESRREMEALLSMLEPALILVMACGVAFVVLAMLLPVLSLNNLAL